MRTRLDKANGRHDNQLMEVNDNRFGLYSTANPLLREAILKMDRWITAIKADTRNIREIDKVVQNKPADVQEGCYKRDSLIEAGAPPRLRRFGRFATFS